MIRFKVELSRGSPTETESNDYSNISGNYYPTPTSALLAPTRTGPPPPLYSRENAGSFLNSRVKVPLFPLRSRAALCEASSGGFAHHREHGVRRERGQACVGRRRGAPVQAVPACFDGEASAEAVRRQKEGRGRRRGAARRQKEGLLREVRSKQEDDAAAAGGGGFDPRQPDASGSCPFFLQGAEAPEPGPDSLAGRGDGRAQGGKICSCTRLLCGRIGILHIPGLGTE